MVLTACNCVTRSSQANFVLKSCLAQVIFGALLSGLCAPWGSPFCCWYSTIWSLHPLTAGQAKEMKVEEGGGRREEKGQEGEQLERGVQITDAIPANYLDGRGTVLDNEWQLKWSVRKLNHCNQIVEENGRNRNTVTMKYVHSFQCEIMILDKQNEMKMRGNWFLFFFRR